MPHIILETTQGFVPQKNIEPLLLSLQNLVAKTANADLSSCKARLIQHEHYIIGDGSKNKGFIHLTIRLLSGRTQEQLKLLGEQAFSLLKNEFSHSGTEVDITTLIDEMAIQHYYKD